MNGGIELRIIVASNRIGSLKAALDATVEEIVAIVTTHHGAEAAAKAEPRELAALYGKVGYLTTAMAASALRIAEQLEQSTT